MGEREPILRRDFLKIAPFAVGGLLLLGAERAQAQTDLEDRVATLFVLCGLIDDDSLQRDLQLLERINDVRAKIGLCEVDPHGNPVYPTSIETGEYESY